MSRNKSAVPLYLGVFFAILVVGGVFLWWKARSDQAVLDKQAEKELIEKVQMEYKFYVDRCHIFKRSPMPYDEYKSVVITGEKTCDVCKELVKRKAMKCKHCDRIFENPMP